MTDTTGARTFQAPTGTRDFYPADLARRRFIENAWRRVSVRHGFDEIDGPTFEHLELYTAKSGDAIVSELFSFRRQGGEKDYALRPEFTPTLARLFAARGAQLPKPARWFWQGPCFRAERPQRGRLREFLQWNCDIVGDPSPQADAEAVACCIGLFESLGLTPADVRVRYSHRAALAAVIERLGVDAEHIAAAFVLLDRRDRLDDADLEAMAFEFGIHSIEFLAFLKRPRGASSVAAVREFLPADLAAGLESILEPLRAVEHALAEAGVAGWCDLDLNVARGLAYYTGMVFEVHEANGKERAIAGGGRYDNLIALCGGPPTPAVGFGMGDVVLSLVLQDRARMPEAREIARALGLRPDVFVISNGTPDADAAMPALLGALRAAGLHARRSYKATKNVGKLLKDAADADARQVVILEGGGIATVKDLDTRAERKGVPLEDVLAAVK